MLLRSNFSSFPHYFVYIFLTSGVKLHIHLLNVVVQFIVFLTLSTLICRSTDISKCFSESLGIRDNGSRLYIPVHVNHSVLFYLTILKVKTEAPDQTAWLSFNFYSLRKHAYSNILKILPPTAESFQIKILVFFIFLLKT